MLPDRWSAFQRSNCDSRAPACYPSTRVKTTGRYEPKLAAFAISGFIAAVGGALLAFQFQAVDAETFSPERSVSIFTITVIGGLTSLPGALLGAIYVEGVPFLFSGDETIRLLTSSVGLLLLVLIVPGGLSEIAYRGRDSFLRWVAARNNIHVPSLVADSLQTGDELDLTGSAADEPDGESDAASDG